MCCDELHALRRSNEGATSEMYKRVENRCGVFECSEALRSVSVEVWRDQFFIRVGSAPFIWNDGYPTL